MQDEVLTWTSNAYQYILTYTHMYPHTHGLHTEIYPDKAHFFIQKLKSINPSPAEPRYTLPLQTV